jgi:hypothetical protein
VSRACNPARRARSVRTQSEDVRGRIRVVEAGRRHNRVRGKHHRQQANAAWRRHERIDFGLRVRAGPSCRLSTFGFCGPYESGSEPRNRSVLVVARRSPVDPYVSVDVPIDELTDSVTELYCLSPTLAWNEDRPCL